MENEDAAVKGGDNTQRTWPLEDAALFGGCCHQKVCGYGNHKMFWGVNIWIMCYLSLPLCPLLLTRLSHH